MSRDQAMLNAFDPAAADALPPAERDLIARRQRVLGPAYRLFYDQPLHIVRGEGVWLEDFAHEFDGKIGNELRDGWLGTVQSTRLELSGTFGSAGTLTILTNDVAPAGPIFME